MKEFEAQSGGRYVYLDDILNLQELAKSFGEIFAGCGNFILRGCTLVTSGSKRVTAGAVWLDGRIRMVPESTEITEYPYYIVCNDVQENVKYANGGSKPGRTNYQAVVTAVKPEKGTQFITVESAVKRPTMLRKFIGQYAIPFTHPADMEDMDFGVHTRLHFIEDISAHNLDMHGPLVLAKEFGDHVKGYMLSSDDYVLLRFQSTEENSPRRDIYFRKDGSCEFKADGVTVASYSDKGFSFNRPVTMSAATISGITVDTEGIRQSVPSSSTLTINPKEVFEDKTYPRNLLVGDGQGNRMVYVDGDKRKTTLEGQTILYGPENEGVVIKSTTSAGEANFSKGVAWYDRTDTRLGYMGYHNGTSIFHIRNYYGRIALKAAEGSYVDLGPQIYENGVALEKKYVKISDFNGAAGDPETGFVTNTDLDERLSEYVTTESFDAEKTRVNATYVSSEALDAKLAAYPTRQSLVAADILDTQWKPVLEGVTNPDYTAVMRIFGPMVSMRCKFKISSTQKTQGSATFQVGIPNEMYSTLSDSFYLSGTLPGGGYWNVEPDRGSAYASALVFTFKKITSTDPDQLPITINFMM